MQTEFEFRLPTGYMDEMGQVHQIGIMRRSRAMDEILPMQDPRVQANPAYATVIILARVIVRLGEVSEVTPQTIENMFASDLSYLQTLYRRINSPNPGEAAQPPEWAEEQSGDRPQASPQSQQPQELTAV